MNSHPADIPVMQVAFPGMNSGTDADAKTLDRHANGMRALKGAHRRLEPDQETIADRLDLDTVETMDFGADYRAMFPEERPPARIAQALGRIRFASRTGRLWRAVSSITAPKL